jgi:hypothetical protein
MTRHESSEEKMTKTKIGKGNRLRAIWAKESVEARKCIDEA